MARIVKAKRQKIKVPILVMGASGSGKTLGSLLIAKGMMEGMYPDATSEEQWDKVGVIDTEHKRTNLYVDTEHDGVRIGEFPKVDLEAPFDSAHYLDAFASLKQYGCEVIVIDGISNAWTGEGGVLQQVDNSTSRGIGGWKDVAPEQRSFLKLLTDQDVHVIATVRSKQGVEVTTDDNGKAQVEKVGLKIEQKDSLEYEFAIAFQVYENHIAQPTKDNSSIFTHPEPLSREVGHKIYDWAEKGVDVRTQEKKQAKKALGIIAELVKGSNAAKLQLERVTSNRPPLENWPVDSLRKLYAELKATSDKEQATQQKEDATPTTDTKGDN
ncbi:hypothetical protein EFS21_01775 [Levilactobacillus brevis]|uniref:ATP-binding protein n=2 Tax=Lactobacillaceae TaxID=33958 RepID=UPI0021A90F3E|nr:ATP-binding protein [Levilactobacillus brevis]MCT3589347.1 hypothetical protein [Levilactobacillus brevis]